VVVTLLRHPHSVAIDIEIVKCGASAAELIAQHQMPQAAGWKFSWKSWLIAVSHPRRATLQSVDYILPARANQAPRRTQPTIEPSAVFTYFRHLARQSVFDSSMIFYCGESPPYCSAHGVSQASKKSSRTKL